MATITAPTVSQEVKDFIFDLHDASRRGLMAEEVKMLYDTKLQELTDQFYGSSSWPAKDLIVSECSGDAEFLCFYSEITFRQLFSNSKLKPKMQDHIDAWNNYLKLFEFVFASKQPEMEISTQWAYDIIQEFVYHFQDFCQKRSSNTVKVDDEALLAQNPGTWSTSEVMNILFKLKTVHEDKAESSSIRKLLSYFGVLEKARLDCLLGDHAASLGALAAVKLSDRSELFTQVPSCHASVFYHAGISMLMLRQYGTMIDTLTEIILHISRSTKGGMQGGNQRGGSQSQLVKTMEKCLAFVTVASVLVPGYRLDVQVQELMEQKAPDRFRRLQNAEASAFEELFGKICPKFISPVQAAGSKAVDLCSEAFKRQVKIFADQTALQLTLVKLRSYLKLYSSIDVVKLAKLNNVSTEDFVAQLVSYKSRMLTAQSTSSADGATSGPSMADVDFFIDSGLLVIESSGKSGKGKETEEFFLSSVKKNTEVRNDIESVFKKYDM
jgi:translation initiation factor 3 subunit L